MQTTRQVRWRAPAALRVRLSLAVALSVVLAGPAGAATFQVCRTFDLAMPPDHKLVVPAGTLYRDDGRADDPLAAFGNDRWQLRLVTANDVIIAPYQQCTRVQVRITSDSQVKSVAVGSNRNLVYAGSDSLLNRSDESEELLTTKGRVLDQVP